MKYFQLNQDTIDYFIAMDFFDSLNCLNRRQSFALGAVAEREDGTDEPAALMVVDQEEDVFVIRWLYVKSEYRAEGIGSGLLQMVFTEAVERKMESVLVRISEEYLEGPQEWDPERFFMECIFEREESVMKEFVFSVKELLKSPDVKKTARENAFVQPLSELSEGEKQQVLDEAGKELRDLLDEDTSYVMIKKGELKAALFVERYGNACYPLLLYGKEETDREMLIRAALSDLKDMDPADRIRVECKSFAAENLLEKLALPGKQYLVSYREANVEDFVALLEAEKEFL